MGLALQTLLLLGLTLLAYFAVPLWLLVRGKILTAATAQLVIAFIPSLFQCRFWPETAGTFDWYGAMMVPLPLLLMVTGLACGAKRIISKLWRPA